MKNIAKFYRFLLLFLITIIIGCGGGIDPDDKDTPTTGKMVVGVDDSYSLLIEAELNVFHYLYGYAKIDTFCRSENEVINAFMEDSLQLIIVNRKLTTTEVENLKAAQIYPKTTRLAYDAVAFIVNKDNPDSLLFYDKIEAIFKGEIHSWKDINSKSDLSEFQVVFDNYKSGNARYFREKFNISKLPEACRALSSNADVIDHVEKNKGSIGIVSVNWISDKEDTVSHSFLNRIKVISITRPGNNDNDAIFYPPHPGYIAEGYYPFTREVFSINRQTYRGLGYGFSSFLAGEKGQMIILRSGMVPATMPVRLVEIKH